MVQIRIVFRSHDKIGLFVTHVKSNSSFIGNVESLLDWTRDVWAVAGH